MILSDKDISVRLNGLNPIIKGIDCSEQIQPASVDLRLANQFVRECERFRLVGGQQTADMIVVRPGEFLLGSTIESVHIPNDLIACLDGKSTWARRGLLIHVTGGYIDPGFSGNVTLEMVNLSSKSISLRAGDRICQIRFHVLSSQCAVPYGPDRGSKYHGEHAVGTIPAREEPF